MYKHIALAVKLSSIMFTKRMSRSLQALCWPNILNCSEDVLTFGRVEKTLPTVSFAVSDCFKVPVSASFAVSMISILSGHFPLGVLSGHFLSQSCKFLTPPPLGSGTRAAERNM